MTEQEQLSWIEQEVARVEKVRSESITLIPVELDDACPTIPYLRAAKAGTIPADVYREAPKVFWEMP